MMNKKLQPFKEKKCIVHNVYGTILFVPDDFPSIKYETVWAKQYEKSVYEAKSEELCNESTWSVRDMIVVWAW